MNPVLLETRGLRKYFDLGAGRRVHAVDGIDLVIREGAKWALVKNSGGEETWRELQDRYGDYKASLGPYDLYDLLAVLEEQWPDIFAAHEDAIRAFAECHHTELEF